MFSFLLLALISTVQGDLYECQNKQITLDDNGYSLHSEMMAPNQDCTLTFTWPDDYIGVVNVDADLDYLEDVYVSSEWGQTLGKVENNKMILNSAWPPNSVNVTIRTIQNSSMILTLILQRQKFSVQSSITKIEQTAPNLQPYFIDTESWIAGTAKVVESATQVAITRAEPATTDTRQWANVFVYEGTDQHRTFRGSIYSLTLTDTIFMSTTKGFTLYFAIPTFNLNGTIVVNDKQNVDFLSYVQTAWSPYDQSNINFDQKYLLDATKGPAALTILSKPDGHGPIYVTKIDYLSADATHVNLLAGGSVMDPIAIGTKLGEYSESTYNLPQLVPGRARTFVLSKGSATVSYTAVDTHANYDAATIGRAGFIMTNNYPFFSVEQDAADFYLKSVDGNPFTLALIFNTLDTNKDSYLNISLKGQPAVPDEKQKPIILSLHTLPVPCVKDFTATEIFISTFGGKDLSAGYSFVYGILAPVTGTPDPNNQGATQPINNGVTEQGTTESVNTGSTEDSSKSTLTHTTTTPIPTTSSTSTYGFLLASLAVFLHNINM